MKNVTKSIVKRFFNLTPFRIVRKKINTNEIEPLEWNSRQGMDDFYSNEKLVERYKSKHREKLYEFVVDLFFENKADIADFGCGPGFFIEFAINKRPDNIYYGYDYSLIAVDLAKKTCPEAQFEEFNILEPTKKKVDIAICMEVLEHLITPDIAFRNLCKSVRSKGRLILTVPDGRADHSNEHINFWSEESWKIWVESNTTRECSFTFDRVKKEKGFDYLVAVLDFKD